MIRACLAAAVLVLSAASTQAKLGIDNIQVTYGPLGPERKTLDIYPYDEPFFRFTVTGAKPDAEGKVDGSVVLQVLDGAGKVVGENQTPAKGVLVLGGNSYPFSVSLPIGQQVPPGKYTVKITVRDNLSKESAAFQRKITVKPLDLKIVRIQFYHDLEGKSAAPAGGTLGETLCFDLRVIGFDRSKERIFTEIAWRIFDSDGQEVSPKGATFDIRQDDAKAVKKWEFLRYGSNSFILTRVGKFTLRITASDRLGKKSTTFEVPIQVTAP
jgi:hypothetical protein